MNRFTVKDLLLNALVGAIYVVLVLALNFLSYADIQFRVAEVLLILLFFNQKLSLGIILGTLIANIGSPLGMPDIVFGTLATTISVLGILLLKKYPKIALLVPVLSNGIIVAIMLKLVLDLPLIISFVTVAFGEAVVLYLVALPLYYYLNKRDDFIELIK